MGLRAHPLAVPAYFHFTRGRHAAARLRAPVSGTPDGRAAWAGVYPLELRGFSTECACTRNSTSARYSSGVTSFASHVAASA